MRMTSVALLVASTCAVGCSSAVLSQDAPSSWGPARVVSAEDVQGVRGIVDGQIASLRRGDAEAAYASAAPDIRRRFHTAAAFLAMAQSNYYPLFKDGGRRFGELRGAAATPTQGETFSQSLDLAEADGSTATAVFGLERQPDGELKITSCVLIPRRPGAV